MRWDPPRVECEDGAVYVAAPDRASLYDNGIAARLEKLARSYGIDGLDVEGRVVLDVGANVGEVSMWALREGAARVVALEPDPETFSALTLNLAAASPGEVAHAAPDGFVKAGRAEAHRLAAWRDSGPLEFYTDTAGASSSAIGSGRPTSRVDAVSLDDFAELHDLKKVRLIKADCEGAEPEMLVGARQLLRRTKYVTVDCGPERHKQTTDRECSLLLLDAGFSVTMVSAKRRILFGTRRR